MKNRMLRMVCAGAMLLFANGLWAQGSEGMSYLSNVLLALGLLVFFFVLVQVSDNLLAIQARQIGVDKSGASFSIFPRLQDLFGPNAPGYVAGQPLTILKKGYNLRLDGVPAGKPEMARVSSFAVQPVNFRGIAPIPKMEVEVGADVKAGDPLFHDKDHPDIKFVAPVSGEVIAINRGEKRAITEVVVLADKEMKYRDLEPVDPEKSSREELVRFLMDSGAWPLIRQRPFEVMAEPGEIPRDIFISTFDTGPLAPDLNLVVEGKGEAFQKGLDVLGRLTAGKVYLGLDARSENPPSRTFTEAGGVEKHWFKGKHPAGNVGIQIHHIKPLNSRDKVWVLGVQDVITIGNLFLERRFNAERIIALTGGELKNPLYVRTYLGAKIADLVNGNVNGHKVRVISGDVLSGKKKEPEQFMDIFDDQLTVIEEGDYFEMFGWLLPLKPRPSMSYSFPYFLFPKLRFKADTNTHGEKRAFVVTGQYEEVLPMDIYPQQLMKAILYNDFEQMEGLGIHELTEEDIALCEFVCTSKQPLQKILREGLDMMYEQG